MRNNRAARALTRRPELGVFALAALAYIAFHCYSFLSYKAIAPDERVIFKTLHAIRGFIDDGVVNLATLQNELAYGSGYWWVSALVDDMLWLRVLNLLFLLGILPLLFFIGKRAQAEGRDPDALPTDFLYAVGLWLTFPLAWFTGKLIGPELMSLFLGFLGICLLRHRRPGLAGFFVGAAIGVKANAVVFAAYALAYAASRRSDVAPSLKAPAYAAGGLALGYVAGNPYILSGLADVLLELREHVTRSSDALANVHHALFADFWTWDCIYNGGLFRITLAVAPFALYLAGLAVFSRDRLTAFLPLAAALALSLFLISGTGAYAWYWFPFAVLLPLGVFEMDPGNPRRRWLLCGLIALNCAFNFEVLSTQLYEKHQQIVNVAEHEDTKAKMSAAIQASRVVFYNILDWSELEVGASEKALVALKKFPDLDGPVIIKLGRRLAKVHGLSYLVDEAKANRSNLSYIAQCNDVDVLYYKGRPVP